MKKDRLYNIIFPIWMILWLPTPFWFVLIPANYLLDTLVLYLSMGRKERFWKLSSQYGTGICIRGFLSDFIGALLLFGIMMFIDNAIPKQDWTLELANGISMNPFKDVPSFLIVLFCIAVSGLCIYLFDKRYLIKKGMETAQAKRSALLLAVVTAPYLYLVPYHVLEQMLFH
ncbi:MAG: hypothetical protein IKE59_07405 [Erysipelotrichaceae bacterium]|nr:hypothetical protein [Erysipelotrichaceae bacterium]